MQSDDQSNMHRGSFLRSPKRKRFWLLILCATGFVTVAVYWQHKRHLGATGGSALTAERSGSQRQVTNGDSHFLSDLERISLRQPPSPRIEYTSSLRYL